MGPARKALTKRNNEIAQRIDQGETVTALATEYGLSRVTIWRAANAGMAAVLPEPEDQAAWRRELTPTLARALQKAEEAEDWANLTRLTDRLSKLLGLDHSDKLNEARVHLESQKMELFTVALFAALDQAGVSESQRGVALEVLVSEVRRLETTP